jgi:hypothetical protein
MTGIAAGAGFAIGITLFYLLVVVVVLPLVMASVFHLALIMFGGARRGFETTYRAICYAYFSALLPSTVVGLVPCLGPLAVAIWLMVLFILGLSRAHETTDGRAAGAVLTTAALCCGLYIAIVVISESLKHGFRV